jgi:hypothetical protein
MQKAVGLYIKINGRNVKLRLIFPEAEEGIVKRCYTVNPTFTAAKAKARLSAF